MKGRMRTRLRSGILLLALSVSSLGAEPDYSGTYVLLQEAVSVTELPVLKDIVATARTVGVVHLEHEGGSLRGKGRVCELQMVSSSNLVKTSFPSAFRRALPELTLNARVSRDGSAVRFEQGRKTMILGARLKEPLRESLPTDADDPRVFDHDRDGKPGVTVSVSGFVSGEVYLVQRSSSRLSGQRTGDGFTGALIFENEQRVVGASSRVLNRDPGATPDAKRSRFHLARVKGPLTCSDAVELARSL